MHEGVSRISLCSRAQRATGVDSSANLELMRSVTVARAVEAFGFEGTKKTLSFISCGLVATVWRWSIPCERHVVARSEKILICRPG